MIKSLLRFNLCVFVTLLFISCSSLFEERNTSISVDLPYGTNIREAIATVTTYGFVITFEHKSSGVKTELKGTSGEKIVLDPADPGEYVISGKAYNEKDVLVYEGETTATVKDGENTEVTLELKKVATEKEPEEDPEEEKKDETVVETDRMKLVAEENGIRITVKTLASDGDTIDYLHVYDYVNNITMTPNKPVPVGESYEFFYPFTEKGKKYTFELKEHVIIGNKVKDINDEASCTAIGGDDVYAGMSGTDDFVLEWTPETKILKVGDKADIEKRFTKKMVSEGRFDEVHISVDVYAGNFDEIQESSYADLFYAYNKTVQADFDTSIYVPELIAEKIEGFKSAKSWCVFANYYFKIPEYSDYYYFTSGKSLESLTFESVDSIDSKHVKVEPCSDGIKVTFKWLEGDGNWYSYTKLHIEDLQMFIEFNENVAPSQSNPEVSYIINTTEKGKFYKMRLELNTDTGFFSEFPCCVAGGGNPSIVSVPKDWGAQKLILDSEKVTVKYSEDKLTSVFSRGLLTKAYDDVFIDCQIWSGNSDWSDVEWVFGTRISVFEDNQYYEDDLKLFVNNGIDVLLYRPMAKYILGGKKDWFAIFKVSFKPAGINTVFTLAENITEATWTGEVYGKYVTGEEALDKENSWNLFYAALEEDLPKVTILNSGAGSSGEFIEFSMDKSFDNDNFELQITKKKEFVAGKSYKVSLVGYCDSDSKVEINVFDSYGVPVNWRVEEISADSEVFFNFSIENVMETAFWTFAIIPYGVGTYKFSELLIY